MQVASSWSGVVRGRGANDGDGKVDGVEGGMLEHVVGGAACHVIFL